MTTTVKKTDQDNDDNNKGDNDNKDKNKITKTLKLRRRLSMSPDETTIDCRLVVVAVPGLRARQQYFNIRSSSFGFVFVALNFPPEQLVCHLLGHHLHIIWVIVTVEDIVGAFSSHPSTFYE